MRIDPQSMLDKPESNEEYVRRRYLDWIDLLPETETSVIIHETTERILLNAYGYKPLC